MEMMTIIVLWILLGIIAAIVIILHFSVYAHIKIGEDGFEIKAKYLFFDIYPRQPKEKKIKKPKRQNSKKQKASKQQFEDDLDNDFGDSDLPSEASEAINEVVEPVVESAAEPVDEFKDTLEKKTDSDSKPEQKQSQQANQGEKNTKKEKSKKSKSDKPKEESMFSKLKSMYSTYKPYLPMGWKYFKKLLKSIRFTGVKIEINVGREDAHEAAIYYGAVQCLLFNNLGHLANIFTVKIKKADVNCIFVKNTISGEAECYVRVRPSTLIAIAFCTGVNFLIVFLKQRHIKKKSQKAEQAGKNNNKNMEVA